MRTYHGDHNNRRLDSCSWQVLRHKGLCHVSKRVDVSDLFTLNESFPFAHPICCPSLGEPDGVLRTRCYSTLTYLLILTVVCLRPGEELSGFRRRHQAMRVLESQCRALDAPPGASSLVLGANI